MKFDVVPPFSALVGRQPRRYSRILCLPAVLKGLLVAIAFSWVIACGPTRQPVPLGAIPDAPRLSRDDRQAGLAVKNELDRSYPELRDPATRDRIGRIVTRLADASDSRGTWMVTVYDAPQVQNAAATRGNQIFIWSGMLRSIRGNDELAAVLAHEMAHVLAGHVNPTSEEILRRSLAQAAGPIAEQLAGRRGLAGLSGLAAESALVYPYTRPLEYEADRVGLMLMAQAGYDPRAALRFWERASKSGGMSFELISSHPASASRLRELRAALPYALDRYQS